MIEILVAIAGIVAMVKIADAENKSTVIWGGLTFALILLSLMLPWAILRVGLASILAFVIMFVYKVVADK